MSVDTSQRSSHSGSPNAAPERAPKVASESAPGSTPGDVHRGGTLGPPQGASPGDRGLGVRALALAAAWLLLVLYVVHSQLPSNAVSLPAQARVGPVLRVVTTQGWAFFTRSPREAQVTAWRLTGGNHWQSAMLGPHSEARNAWGLNRASRSQGVEMGILLAALTEADWNSCADGIPESCMPSSAAATVTTANPMPAPTLCGPVALVAQEPLPWAWASEGAEERMPLRWVRMDVSC